MQTLAGEVEIWSESTGGPEITGDSKGRDCDRVG